MGYLWGYDRASPAYMIYHNDTNRVQRCRCVKFTDLFALPLSTNMGVLNPALVLSDDASNEENPLAEPINNDGQDDLIEPDQVNGNDAPPPEIIAEPPRYERRDNQRKPPHLDDYVCSNVDMCYSVSSVSIPRTYSEAIDSPECSQWKEAMNNEINSLKLNDTYDLVILPQGKKAV